MTITERKELEKEIRRLEENALNMFDEKKKDSIQKNHKRLEQLKRKLREC